MKPLFFVLEPALILNDSPMISAIANDQRYGLMRAIPASLNSSDKFLAMRFQVTSGMYIKANTKPHTNIRE